MTFVLQHWEWAAALTLIAVLYGVLAKSVRPLDLPRWSVGGAALLLFVAFLWLHRSGRHGGARGLGVGVALMSWVAIAVSMWALAFLPSSELPRGAAFFVNAAAIWTLNVVVFAFAYWQLDGGGPTARRAKPYRSTDFAFPQFQLDDLTMRETWKPNGWDYLFLAFNTSTAFSPADTVVLTRSAKALMMAQSLTSLVVVSVLVGRGVSVL